MENTIRLRCINRHISLGTVPDAISGAPREREFNVWEFAHPMPPQPPPNATPREMARFMALQPTTAATVSVRTIDPKVTFEIGKEYHLSITSDEELES